MSAWTPVALFLFFLVAEASSAGTNVAETPVDPALTEGTDGECFNGEEDCHVGLMQLRKSAVSQQCDWQCYLNRYPDLRRAFGETNTGAAANHWGRHGRGENRDCTCNGLPTCDWQGYLDRYPDLQNAFGATNVGAAQTHWRNHGQDEGRDCTAEADCCPNPDVTYATCSAWGDPHFTKTFSGPNTFDFQGLGTYKLATSADGAFELQAFQCKPRPNANVAVYAGFALRTGGTAASPDASITTIIGDTVTVDGRVTTQSSENMEINLPHVETCSATPCAKFKYHKTAIPSYTLGYESSFHLYLDSTNVGHGICATGGAPSEPVDCADSLFTMEQMQQLCQVCGMENCDVCPTQPEDYTPADTPEEVCEAAGLSFQQAQRACSSVANDANYYHACLVDYCASDGDDSVIDSVNDAVQREEEEDEEPVVTVTNAPTPVPTSAPTPFPTLAPSPSTPFPVKTDDEPEAEIYGDPHVVSFNSGK